MCAPRIRFTSFTPANGSSYRFRKFLPGLSFSGAPFLPASGCSLKREFFFLDARTRAVAFCDANTESTSNAEPWSSPRSSLLRRFAGWYRDRRGFTEGSRTPSSALEA